VGQQILLSGRTEDLDENDISIYGSGVFGMNVVAHNFLAANAATQLGINNKKYAKSSEKLSSGYQINRAADDAAGLSISEKMRSQIRRLNQAAKNVEDGQALIDVADGALQQIQNIMGRQRELLVKAANDVNASDDRQAIEDELIQLNEEIDDIASRTEFNGIKIFDSGSYLQGPSQTVNVSNENLIDDTKTTTTVSTIWVPKGTSAPANTSQEETLLKDEQWDYDYSGTSSFNSLYNDIYPSYNTEETEKKSKYTEEKTRKTEITYTLDTSASIQSNPNYATMDAYQMTQTITEAHKKDVETTTTTTSGWLLPKYINIQSGANEGERTFFYLSGLTTESLHFEVGKDKQISAFHGANSIKHVDRASKEVSSLRSYYGAISNRLDHTYNNDLNYSENLQSAESQIRDTDMASEMTNFTKNSILMQAAQSMISQANSNAQSVLSLLS
jgi:flagellin